MKWEEAQAPCTTESRIMNYSLGQRYSKIPAFPSLCCRTGFSFQVQRSILSLASRFRPIVEPQYYIYIYNITLNRPLCIYRCNVISEWRSIGYSVNPISALYSHFPNGGLHPKLRILLMQPVDVGWHCRLRLPQPLIKDTLQSKFGNAFVPIYHCRHLEETIGFPNVAFEWGVTASDDDASGGVLNDLEMVCDLRSDGVAG